MTELEKKLLLSKDEYNSLLQYSGKNGLSENRQTVKQINYYFDTDDLSMNQQNITCRIRLKDGKYKGTMKQHIPNTDRSTETEIEVRDGIRDNGFIDMGLTLQGELATERCVILKNEIYEIVLDKNEYLGQIDYELEIEYAPDQEHAVQSILHTLLDMFPPRNCFLALEESFTHHQNAKSKSNRFFERRAKMNSIFPQLPQAENI